MHFYQKIIIYLEQQLLQLVLTKEHIIGKSLPILELKMNSKLELLKIGILTYKQHLVTIPMDGPIMLLGS